MELRWEPLKLDLRETFRISRETSDTRQNVLLAIAGPDGLTGLGEAAPSRYYHESAESVISALEKLDLSQWHGPDLLEEILAAAKGAIGSHPAAISALDMAIHDLIGKQLGVPLYQFWGLNPSRTPATSFTIGLASLDEIRRKTQAASEYSILKIKLGTDHDQDIIRTIREVTDVPIRVDANAAWAEEEAIENSHWLREEGVEFIEQPLPADDLDGLSRVSERSALPIIADESSRTPEDVVQLKGRVHGINIKLAKCGGLREALKMIRVARAQKMKVMLGCMLESSLGITAAAHLSPLVDYADLDGHLLISNDPFEGVRVEQGKLILPARPGLGVTRVPRPGTRCL